MKISRLSVLCLAFWVLCGFDVQDNTVAVVGDSIMRTFPINQTGLGWIILEDLPAFAQPAQVQTDFLETGGAMLGSDNSTSPKRWSADNCTATRVGYDCIEAWEPEGLVVAIGTNDLSWFFDYGCDINEVVNEYAQWIDKLLSVEYGNPDLEIIFVFVHPGHSGYELPGTENFLNFGTVEDPVETPCGPCVDESYGAIHCISVHNSNYQVWIEDMKPMLGQRNIPFIDVFDQVFDLYGHDDEGVAAFARDFLDDGIHIVDESSAALYYDVFLEEELHEFYAAVLHDITPPKVPLIVASLGPEGSDIPLEMGMVFSQDNQTISWYPFDPYAPAGPDDQYGVAHSYFSYKKNETGSSWSSEIELTLSGVEAGYLGPEKWVRPVMLMPEDGQYWINLISEDAPGNRSETYRFITVDTTPPVFDTVITNLGSGGSYIPLEDNMTYASTSDVIIWVSRDPNYPGDSQGWGSRLGIVRSYFTYREVGQTEWAPEIESVWLGGLAGYWGRWSWVCPSETIPADGQYEIKLISEDAAGFRVEAVYEITVDTSGG